jgi:predicted nucleotidyltransferase
MGASSTLNDNDAAVRMLAQRLRADGAEQVYLFGSRATGRAAPDSDYDLIIVSKAFEGVPRLTRHFGMHDIFYAVGGNAPLDLICLTPEEFEGAKGRPTLVRSVMPDAVDLLAETPAPA